jgi:hypothetical protein
MGGREVLEALPAEGALADGKDQVALGGGGDGAEREGRGAGKERKSHLESPQSLTGRRERWPPPLSWCGRLVKA